MTVLDLETGPAVSASMLAHDWLILYTQYCTYCTVEDSKILTGVTNTELSSESALITSVSLSASCKRSLLFLFT